MCTHYNAFVGVSLVPYTWCYWLLLLATQIIIVAYLSFTPHIIFVFGVRSFDLWVNVFEFVEYILAFLVILTFVCATSRVTNGRTMAIVS